MPRDHTRVNLDIWGDDEFRDLPVDAQNLYWRLWTSPERTYCGSHEWRPGKLVQSAGDWTVDRLVAAAAVLSERLFLIIDTETEECLLRSWIKHDGLWKTPNMAVSMANARSALGSKVLRGVIVHEVKKLVEAEPDLGGWKRDEVRHLLTQNAVDPASLEPFNPGPNGGVNPTDNPAVNPPANPYGHNGVNPSLNPPATTATSTPTSTNGGYVGTEGYEGDDPEPPRYCSKHPNDTTDFCQDCIPLRVAHDEWKQRRSEREQDELEHRRSRKAAEAEALRKCHHCKGTNWIVGDDGTPVEPAVKCTKHLLEVS